MDKEEIIKKIKNDNKRKDEREKFIDGKSEIYASIVICISLLILIITSVVRKTDILGFLTLIFSGVFGEFIGKVKYNKNFNNISSAIVFGILFVFCLIEFLKGNSFIIDINL